MIPTLVDYIIWRTHVGRMVFCYMKTHTMIACSYKYRLPQDIIGYIMSCNQTRKICLRCLKTYPGPSIHYLCGVCHRYLQTLQMAHKLFALWNNERWDLYCLQQEAKWWRKHSGETQIFKHHNTWREHLKTNAKGLLCYPKYNCHYCCHCKLLWN